MRWILVIAALFALPTAEAQHAPNASAEAMRKLGYLVGEWRGTASAVESEPTVTADTLVWGFNHPQAGQLRYTITRTADGDWHEIGERSADGKTNWMKIIEMRLTKIAMAP